MGREKSKFRKKGNYYFDDEAGHIYYKDAALIRAFLEGRYVSREVLKRNRQKIPNNISNEIITQFINQYEKRDKNKRTINAAIVAMCKRDSKGEYLFKKLSKKIKSIQWKDEEKRHKQEKKFIESQVKGHFRDKKALDDYLKYFGKVARHKFNQKLKVIEI